MTSKTERVVDFHMHPGPAWVPGERRLHTAPDIIKPFADLLADMEEVHIDKAVVMLLDEEWFSSPAGEVLMDVYRRRQWDKRLVFCAMFDVFRAFEMDAALDAVNRAASLGLKGIKIHPLLQRINYNEFHYLDLLASQAEKNKMFIVVHAFEDDLIRNGNSGLDVVSHIAGRVDVPVIIAHAGGLDFSRAVLIAGQYPNVSLDLSFVFHSRAQIALDKLLGWGIETIGIEKFLYGSDHPSCPAGDYKETVNQCLNAIGLTENEKAQIMSTNAMKIIK